MPAPHWVVGWTGVAARLIGSMLQEVIPFAISPMASFLPLRDLSVAQNDIKGMRELPVILVVRSEAVTTDQCCGVPRSRRGPGECPSVPSSLPSLLPLAPGKPVTTVTADYWPQGSKRGLTRTLEESFQAQGNLRAQQGHHLG